LSIFSKPPVVQEHNIQQICEKFEQDILHNSKNILKIFNM